MSTLFSNFFYFFLRKSEKTHGYAVLEQKPFFEKSGFYGFFSENTAAKPKKII